MEQAIGRPRVARAYALLIALATLQVVVQAFLFAGFYSKGEKGFITAHAVGADISLLVVVLIVTPLAFLARFRRDRRIGWLTLTLAVLWFVQHSLGYGIRGRTVVGDGPHTPGLTDFWTRPLPYGPSLQITQGSLGLSSPPDRSELRTSSFKSTCSPGRIDEPGGVPGNGFKIAQTQRPAAVLPITAPRL